MNCDCVSFLAPIYKETLKKKQLEDSSIDVTEKLKSPDELDIKPENKKIIKVRSLSMDSGENHLRKCQLCLINPSQLTNYDCKHRIRLPSINNQSKKLSFDESISYTTTNKEQHIYYSNRKINKSLSSISDPIGSVSGTVFGEKIQSSTNRPNSLIVTSNFEERTTIRRSFRSNTHQDIPNSIKRNQIPISTSQHQFRQQPPIYNNCTILCDVCGICNKNQCSNQEQNSRFTVTTISRSESLSNRVKNLTLPKNGGVFVAVRDWFAAATPISSGNLQLNQNQSTFEPSEPIYAVVNKANKNRNKIETKFSYVGIAEQNNRLDPEGHYSSLTNPSNSDMKTTHITTTISGNSCNKIDSGGTSDSSSIYAEVWKGPRKSLDSQKMYVLRFSCCCFFLLFGMLLAMIFYYSYFVCFWHV